MQSCQKTITFCGKARPEDVLSQEIKLYSIAKAHQSIIENPMAKKYGHIWRTDQSNPQSNYRKYLISSKENHTWAILADFSPCSSVTSNLKCTVLSSYTQDKIVLLLDIFSSLDKCEKSEKVITASSRSFWW